MSGINPIGFTPSGTNVLSTGESKFGENPFLSLLITQLRNQTPLEPVDNASFMQQMATFSSMQEQKELNSNMLKLLDFQGVLARLQSLSEGSTMLGKKVTFLDGNEKSSGIVNSIFVDDRGEVRLRVGEKEIAMRQITGIENPPVEKDPESKKDPNKK